MHAFAREAGFAHEGYVRLKLASVQTVSSHEYSCRWGETSELARFATDRAMREVIQSLGGPSRPIV